MPIRSNPWVQKVMAAGEAQLDRLASQILGSERFISVVQTAVSRTLSARDMLDRSIRAVLATMNLPSVQDIDDLRRRLDELDRSISELADKLGQLEKAGAAPKTARTRTAAFGKSAAKKATASTAKKKT